MPETALVKVSDHVFWMTPGKPDRTSLCAVVGTDHTLLIDAGASSAHTRLFLGALKAAGVPVPSYVALTHWHWDHVFGAVDLHIPIIAQRETAQQLAVLASYDWHDPALDQRVATGEEISFCADNIKLELPEPRSVKIVLPDIIFDNDLDLHLGGVECHIQHVGGDHASDSCVMHILPDQVLVLGDCLYDAIYSPIRHYTKELLLPLLDTLFAFGANHYIEGHNPDLLTQSELKTLADKMRLASDLADQYGTDETAALGQICPPDEDTADFVRAFIGGKRLEVGS